MKKLHISILIALAFSAILLYSQTTSLSGLNGNAILSATSSSLGGSLLAVGTPVTTSVTVTGATLGMGCVASPSSGNALLTGTWVDCYVSAANTVTLRLIGTVVTTPTAQTYVVRVMP